MGAIDEIIGLAEVGVIVGAFMFGLATVQTYTYFSNYPNDPRVLKSFVAIVWILGLVLTILVCQSLYWQTITMFGRADEAVHRLPQTLGVQLLVSVILTGSIQAYFAERVRQLSGRLLIPIICWVFAVLRFVGFVALAVLSFQISDAGEFKHKYSWLLTSMWSISAFVDILITTSLIWDLWPRRNRAFNNTQKIVDQVIVWSIQTGLVVSIASILMLVFFITLNNNAWNLVGFLIPKAFANFLLSSLNSRSPSRSQVPTSIEHNRVNAYPVGQTSQNKAMAIEMTVSREIMRDRPSDKYTSEFSPDF